MQNKLNKLFNGISARDVYHLMENDAEKCVFLDVRTPQEYEEIRIPGFDLIPLSDLKRRIDEILPDRKIILLSQSGSRAYQASLILRAHNFTDVLILEGGLRMWPYSISRG
jgi:rhodanese-related sulfurtransferase